RRAATAPGRSQGASVPHLHHRAQFAGRGGLWPRQAGRVFPRHAEGTGAEQGPADQGAGEHRLSRAEVTGDLLPDRRLVPARVERDRRGVLPAHRPRLQGRGDSGVGVLRTGRGDVSRAFLLCQEGRNARHCTGAFVRRGAPSEEVKGSDMRKQSRDHIRLAGALAAVLLFSTQSEAEQRTVNFYNWSNYMAPEVLEDFTKETGIKVVYDTFDANEALETRLLAGKSGYDVVVPTGYFLQRQITAKVFLKLDKAKLPNLANAWPVVSKQLATYDP